MYSSIINRTIQRGRLFCALIDLSSLPLSLEFSCFPLNFSCLLQPTHTKISHGIRARAATPLRAHLQIVSSNFSARFSSVKSKDPLFQRDSSSVIIFQRDHLSASSSSVIPRDSSSVIPRDRKFISPKISKPFFFLP
jgi:hypothetical protein